jgi:hypothetical protein
MCLLGGHERTNNTVSKRWPWLGIIDPAEASCKHSVNTKNAASLIISPGYIMNRKSNWGLGDDGYELK